LYNKTKIAKSLRKYGLSDPITDAYLASKIKIIEIYKVLNFSSKIKERNLCEPLEAMSFFVSNDYFVRDGNSTIKSLVKKINMTIYSNMTVNMSDIYLLAKLRNMSAQHLGDYDMASKLCKIPKRQLISDADYLSKEINIPFISNYVRKVV
jgi:hypothetical protein